MGFDLCFVCFNFFQFMGFYLFNSWVAIFLWVLIWLDECVMCIRIRLTTSIETTTRRSQSSDPCGATGIPFFKRPINMVRFKNTLNPNQNDLYPTLILTYIVHFMIIYLYHQVKRLISFLCK